MTEEKQLENARGNRALEDDLLAHIRKRGEDWNYLPIKEMCESINHPPIERRRFEKADITFPVLSSIDITGEGAIGQRVRLTWEINRMSSYEPVESKKEMKRDGKNMRWEYLKDLPVKVRKGVIAEIYRVLHDHNILDAVGSVIYCGMNPESIVEDDRQKILAIGLWKHFIVLKAFLENICMEGVGKGVINPESEMFLFPPIQETEVDFDRTEPDYFREKAREIYDICKAYGNRIDVMKKMLEPEKRRRQKSNEAEEGK